MNGPDFSMQRAGCSVDIGVFKHNLSFDAYIGHTVANELSQCIAKRESFPCSFAKRVGEEVSSGSWV